MSNQFTRRYEDNAVRIQPPEGWACATCGRWYANEAGAEHMAAWCCCKDRPCQTEGCDGRADRARTACERCIAKKDDERWAKVPKKPLSELTDLSETPLCIWDDDTYFFDWTSVEEYAIDRQCLPSDLRLMICGHVEPPLFSLHDYLADHMPEDGEVLDDEAEDKINALIRDACPYTFYPGKFGVDPDSIPVMQDEAPR